MPQTVPVRASNAIDEIAFAIHFKTPLVNDEKSINDLNNLAHEVRDLLPVHEIMNAVTLQLNNLQSNQAATKPSGIICYKKSEQVPDRQEWRLQVEESRIIVGCSEYTSWEQILPNVERLLQTAIAKFDLSINPIVEIVYQCADKFVCRGGKTNLKDVFNPDSNFLTKNIILNDPSAWHVHQSWFTKLDKPSATFLHNLNINMQNRPPKNPDQAQQESVHETIISHFIRVQKTNGLEINSNEELIGGESSYLNDILNITHDLNKDTVKQLLNAEMQQKTGICA